MDEKIEINEGRCSLALIRAIQIEQGADNPAKRKALN